MSTLKQKSGEHAQIESLVEQENTSRFKNLFGDRWLIENGMMPETAIDNLLAFGYMIPGVVNVELEINQEKKFVKYDVKVDPKYFRKYSWVNSLSQGGIFKKIAALILVNVFNAPKPFIYRDFILTNAKIYLPNFEVEINVGR